MTKRAIQWTGHRRYLLRVFYGGKEGWENDRLSVAIQATHRQPIGFDGSQANFEFWQKPAATRALRRVRRRFKSDLLCGKEYTEGKNRIFVYYRGKTCWPPLHGHPLRMTVSWQRRTTRGRGESSRSNTGPSH